jgi:hypothetical protein
MSRRLQRRFGIQCEYNMITGDSPSSAADDSDRYRHQSVSAAAESTIGYSHNGTSLQRQDAAVANTPAYNIAKYAPTMASKNLGISQ